MLIRFRRRPLDPLELLVELSVEIETSLVKSEWGILGRGRPEEVREKLVELAEELFAAMEEGKLSESYAKELRARLRSVVAG
ncbi:MAG: hypothetical protein QXU91_01085 [Thermofilum sp.]